MNSLQTLHCAARQYCIDTATSWRHHYAQLVANDKAAVSSPGGGWCHTADACDIFPRFDVLDAIRRDVECLLPTDFKSLDDERGILELAGFTAQSHFTNFTDPVAIAAAEDERQRFALFVRTLDEAHIAVQRELPLHRILGAPEHKDLHDRVAQRWGNWYGGFRDREDSDLAVVTLHVEAMNDPESYHFLRTFLIERDVTRLFELREYGDGFEMDTELAGFTYNGAEGFWTGDDFGWLVYASHESSITFGSAWLVEKMRTVVPEFERYIYKGWDLAAYA